MSERYENLFNEADRSLGFQRERLLQRLAEAPTDEVIPMLLHVLRDNPDKCTGDTAIKLIDIIGYPRNEPTFPTLVILLSANVNDPRYSSAIDALLHIGPDVIVPYLLRILLGKGKPYFDEPYFDDTNYDTLVWANTVEGICYMIGLEKTEKEYAIRCCPAINYLLSLDDPALNSKYEALLEAIGKVTIEADYVIPTLIKFVQKHGESKIGKQAQQLLLVFKQEALKPYQFLLNEFSL